MPVLISPARERISDKPRLQSPVSREGQIVAYTGSLSEADIVGIYQQYRSTLFSGIPASRGLEVIRPAVEATVSTILLEKLDRPELLVAQGYVRDLIALGLQQAEVQTITAKAAARQTELLRPITDPPMPRIPLYIVETWLFQEMADYEHASRRERKHVGIPRNHANLAIFHTLQDDPYLFQEPQDDRSTFEQQGNDGKMYHFSQDRTEADTAYRKAMYLLLDAALNRRTSFHSNSAYERYVDMFNDWVIEMEDAYVQREATFDARTKAEQAVVQTTPSHKLGRRSARAAQELTELGVFPIVFGDEWAHAQRPATVAEQGTSLVRLGLVNPKNYGHAA